jgi:hypothetical protein
MLAKFLFIVLALYRINSNQIDAELIKAHHLLHIMMKISSKTNQALYQLSTQS